MPPWVEISIPAILRNYAYLRDVVRPATLVPVLKCDAYGHGATAVALALEAGAQARVFATGTADEGLRLRRAGIVSQILVLAPCAPDEVELAAVHDLQPFVSSWTELEEIDSCSRRRGLRIAVHLEVDVGMGRFGCSPDLALDMLERAAYLAGVDVCGVAAHFGIRGPDDVEVWSGAFHRFRELVDVVRLRGRRPLLIHCAASVAGILAPSLRYDMVRSGVALFGLDTATDGNLRPAMSVHSKIRSLRHLSAGSTLGYSRGHVLLQAASVAYVDAGYGVGFNGALARSGQVIVRDVPCPVVGGVGMSTIAVQVDDVPGALTAGEPVTLFSGAHSELTIEAAARRGGMLPDEVAINLSRGAEKHYVP